GAVRFPFPAFLLLFALPRNGQGSALQTDVDVFLFHAGEFGPDGDFVLVLIYIQRWLSAFEEGRARNQQIERILENSIDLVPDSVQFVNRGCDSPVRRRQCPPVIFLATRQFHSFFFFLRSFG